MSICNCRISISYKFTGISDAPHPIMLSLICLKLTRVMSDVRANPLLVVNPAAQTECAWLSYRAHMYKQTLPIHYPTMFHRLKRQAVNLEPVCSMPGGEWVQTHDPELGHSPADFTWLCYKRHKKYKLEYIFRLAFVNSVISAPSMSWLVHTRTKSRPESLRRTSF